MILLVNDANIPVHGILWIFDQLVTRKIITTQAAHEKLKRLLNMNPRLPTKESQIRLKKWMQG